MNTVDFLRGYHLMIQSRISLTNELFLYTCMFIYVIGPYTHGPIKIGFTKDLHRRLKGIQTGHPEPLKIHYSVEVPDNQTRTIESIIHKENKFQRTSGEWFNLSISEGIQEVQHAVIRYLKE